MENSFGTAENTNVSVGATSTAVIPENPRRVSATFVNDSDETIYLSLSDTAVINEGIRINASGGSYEILGENLYKGPVSAICASGGKNLVVMESNPQN